MSLLLIKESHFGVEFKKIIRLITVLGSVIPAKF
jgi:hypothetical protein